MNKEFTNIFGAKLIIQEYGMKFSSPNVKLNNADIDYSEIESIKIKNKGKNFTVQYNGGRTIVFVINQDDRMELSELIPEIKKRVLEERDEDDIKKAIRKQTRAVIGWTLISLVLVGLMVLKSWFNTIAISILLLLSTALFLTWLKNTRSTITPPSLSTLKTRNCVIQIIIMLVCISVSLGCFFYFKPGFKEGNYPDEKCSWVNCNLPANGGMYRGGLKDNDRYYCREHFEVEKESAESKSNNTPDEYDVWVIAIDEVKSRLKSPSTADFCSQSNATITKSGKKWTVTGYVDAQNSFGATLRNNFKVVITFSSGNKYTVDSCTIN